MSSSKENPLVRIPTANGASPAVLSSGLDPGTVAALLNLPNFRSVLWLIGGADSLDATLQPVLEKLIKGGVWQGAAAAEAIVIDGGTDAGIMRLAGKAKAESDVDLALVGVAPAALVDAGSAGGGKTPLEPNHSHFVLTGGGRWGDETQTALDLIEVLTGRAGSRTRKYWLPGKSRRYRDRAACVVVLAGGGDISHKEVHRAIGMGLPVIVIGGSGGLADALCTAKDLPSGTPAQDSLAGILEDGKGLLQYFPAGGETAMLKAMVLERLDVDSILLDAWQDFAKYDKNANRQQFLHFLIQLAILVVGVALTMVVIFMKIIPSKKLIRAGDPPDFWKAMALLLPVLSTLLLTIANRFKHGNKWLLLRSAAEQVKREIFSYRVAKYYHPAAAAKKLAGQLQTIVRRTMGTEVNRTFLRPYDAANGLPPGMFGSDGRDDGFSALDPERYVRVRLEDQLHYYRGKVGKITFWLNSLTWATYVITAAGTGLAVFNLQLWIALTTSTVAAIGAWLGYKQSETTIVKYNQTAANLESILLNWKSMTPAERKEPAKIDELINGTEATIQNEFDGWMQQMKSALEEMEQQQQKQAQNGQVSPGKGRAAKGGGNNKRSR